ISPGSETRMSSQKGSRPAPTAAPASPHETISGGRPAQADERHYESWSAQARAQSEQLYALAMASINEGVYDWNVDTGEVYFSPQLRVMLGLEPDEMATANEWLERIHPDAVARYQRPPIAHFKAETARFESEYRYRVRDGTWRWARHHGIAQRGADGRAHRMVGATGDISETKQRERELHSARAEAAAARGDVERTREAMQTVLDNMNDGVML